MPKAISMSPMIPSRDIPKTADFFINHLGFEAVMNSESYAVLVKDGASVHLLPAGEDIGGMDVYLETDAVDEVWKQIEPHLRGIRHRAPFDQPYGMREIHLDVPETNCLLFIGQVISAENS